MAGRDKDSFVSSTRLRHLPQAAVFFPFGKKQIGDNAVISIIDVIVVVDVAVVIDVARIITIIVVRRTKPPPAT